MSSNRWRTAVLGGLGIALLAGQAAADVCETPRERRAIATRVFQTELMVAALACDERGRYNAFVRKFESDLVDRGQTLKTIFSRAHGNRATGQLTSFVTRLANEASLRSLDTSEDFCAQAADMFGKVLIADRKDFDELVEFKSSSVDTCVAALPRTERTAGR